jgi:hypothetical protein
VRINNKSAVLVVQGIQVDVVGRVGQLLAHETDESAGAGAFRTVISDWKDVAGISNDINSMGSIQQLNFWSTILCGMETFEFREDQIFELDPPRRIQGALEYLPPATPEIESRITTVIGEETGMLSGRRFMITSTGRMGVGPQITKPGDLLCVLLGSYVAFILRSCGDNFYKLIGDW